MATLTDIVKAKAGINAVIGDPNYLGYWADLTGSVLLGQIVSRDGDFWQAVELIADVTASTPTVSNDSWFKRQDAVFDFTVSQYAVGNPAIVSYIYKNRSISSIEYFIWPATGQVFATNGATGTFSDPLDFDPATGVDSGITGTLSQVNSVLPSSIPKTFTSTAQLISQGGLVTVAHGLLDANGSAIVPFHVDAFIVCTTAENGFSIGDRQKANLQSSDAGTTRISTIYYDDTDISIRYPNTTQAFLSGNKADGNGVVLTNANWELYLTAWY